MESSHPKSEDNHAELAAKKKRAIKAPLLNAEKLHSVPHAPERIGHVLVSGEAAERRSNKSAATRSGETLARAIAGAEGLRTAAAGKRIETLNRAELLSMAEKITVNGSTLRQIYETHLIGERGLRRLITEQLRGGNIEEALRREIVEHEIDFERDPALRDMKPDGPVDTAADSESVLIKLLENAAGSIPDSNEEVAFYKAQASYHAAQDEVQQKRRHLLDLALVGIIAMLVALVIILYLTRH
jgi:hypothetical protein